MIYDDVMKQKRVAHVELYLMSGDVWKGVLFIQIRQRPLEVLNDDRKFIPFRDEDGNVHIINKDTIARVLPIGEPELESGASEPPAPAVAER